MFRLLGHSLSTDIALSPSGNGNYSFSADQLSDTDTGIAAPSTTPTTTGAAHKPKTSLGPPLQAFSPRGGGNTALGEEEAFVFDDHYLPDDRDLLVMDEGLGMQVDEQDVAALQRSLKRSQRLLDEMAYKASVTKAALEVKEAQVTELQTEKQRQCKSIGILKQTEGQLLEAVETYRRREARLLTVLRMLALTLLGVGLTAVVGVLA